MAQPSTMTLAEVTESIVDGLQVYGRVQKKTLATAWKLGADLTVAKEMVKAEGGKWLPYLNRLEVARRSAQRYMKLYRAYPDRDATGAFESMEEALQAIPPKAETRLDEPSKVKVEVDEPRETYAERQQRADDAFEAHVQHIKEKRAEEGEDEPIPIDASFVRQLEQKAQASGASEAWAVVDDFKAGKINAIQAQIALAKIQFPPEDDAAGAEDDEEMMAHNSETFWASMTRVDQMCRRFGKLAEDEVAAADVVALVNVTNMVHHLMTLCEENDINPWVAD